MANKIRILHLEDNDFDSELLISTLSGEGLNFYVQRVSHKNEFIEEVTNNRYDLIISDNSLPDFDGIEALRQAKRIQPLTPFIFLSGTLQEDIAIEAMRWGASDYVLKDKPSKLGLTVKRVLSEYERKRELDLANKKIQESEEKYRLITENSADAIFVVNQQGEYVYVNPEATKLLGYSKEEFLQMTILNVTPPDMINNFLNLFQKVITDKRAFYELELLKKDGSLLPVDVNAVILPNGFIYGSCRDISIRKMAENEIIKAKEKAEEMNRIKSYFLSNMSHELRTPMIAIIGYADLLSEEIVELEHKKMLDGIVEGATRLLSTFQNILELSRFESSTSNLKTSVVALQDIIEECLDPLFKIAARKNLYLKTVMPSNKILVDIEPGMFKNAVFQLVDNGIKFTKNGGVVVQVSSIRKDNHIRALIEITDSGVGIKPEDIKKIFGEFRQASEGLNRSYEGLGVGLHLVNKIIELINGEISVSSQVGKGTSITISLPVKLTEEELSNEIAVRNKTSSFEEPSVNQIYKKPSVLLVEDNPLNKDVIIYYLKENYSITDCSDGISALVLAARSLYDIVLMDINLGEGIDGIETLNRLRRIENYVNVPIIAVTAYVMPEDRERILNQGFDGYLPKPFTKETINKLLGKYLK